MINKLKKITKAALLLNTMLLFQSCIIFTFPSQTKSFQKETAKNGLIIGSITFPKEKARFNGYFIKVNAKDSIKKNAKKNSTEIHIIPEQLYRMKHNGELDNELTYLFLIERPPGKYEIPSIRLFTNSVSIAYQKISYVGGFSIPFDVEKGEITYIGNINFNEYLNENDTLIKYLNKYERDINAFKKIQPSVDWNSSINDTNRKIEYNNIEIKK